MNAGDNSLVGGLISASTLMLCHAALARLAFHFPRVGRWVDGKAQVLIDQGKLEPEPDAQEAADPRRRGGPRCAPGLPHAHEVERATIETNGQITVVLRRRGE